MKNKATWSVVLFIIIGLAIGLVSRLVYTPITLLFMSLFSFQVKKTA